MKILLSRAPVALGFLALSAAASLIAGLSDTRPLLALHPSSVIENGFIWQFVTYSFVHTGVLHLLLACSALLVVAVFVEPVLGVRRSALLMVASAMLGGAAHLLLGVAPILGAVLVGNGYGAAFFVLALLHRVPRTWPASAVFLGCLGYAMLELEAPVDAVLAIIAVWIVGLVVAIRSARYPERAG